MAATKAEKIVTVVATANIVIGAAARPAPVLAPAQATATGNTTNATVAEVEAGMAEVTSPAHGEADHPSARHHSCLTITEDPLDATVRSTQVLEVPKVQRVTIVHSHLALKVPMAITADLLRSMVHQDRKVPMDIITDHLHLVAQGQDLKARRVITMDLHHSAAHAVAVVEDVPEVDMEVPTALTHEDHHVEAPSVDVALAGLTWAHS